MRLTELSPKWVTLHGWASPSPFYIGLTFQCPHCRTQRLGVMFAPPIDPDGVMATFGAPMDIQQYARERNAPVWARSDGDSFDSLTLAPSINAENFEGHWHGFITNGEVT